VRIALRVREGSRPDPYNGSYDLSDPQSFNRYAYSENDPVNFIDPTGMDECSEFDSQSACVVHGGVGNTGFPGTSLNTREVPELNPAGELYETYVTRLPVRRALRRVRAGAG
jgi:hypothetical protein